MTEAKVDINLDKPCTKCGQMGATGSGLCLECVAEQIVDWEKLIVKSLVSASKQIDLLMAQHSTEVYRAYRQSDDGKLTIGITVELSPSKEMRDTIVVLAKINFVESRVRDQNSTRVSAQQELPLTPDISS